jgi:Tfp pilus assembly protein PilN
MARRINLIPRSERARTKTDFGLLAMVGLFIIVVFGLGFGYYSFSNVLDDRRQELGDLETQTAKLEAEVQALHEYEILATQREGVQNVVQSIYTSRTLLSDVLDAVGLVIPENAWFQSLDLSAADPIVASAKAPAAAAATPDSTGVITIQGKTYDFEDLSRLIVRLQLIPSLQDVTLTSATETQKAEGEQPSVKEFSIGAAVVEPELPGTLPLTDVEVESR